MSRSIVPDLAAEIYYATSVIRNLQNWVNDQCLLNIVIHIVVKSPACCEHKSIGNVWSNTSWDDLAD